jgi:hypothetical protein
MWKQHETEELISSYAEARPGILYFTNSISTTENITNNGLQFRL